MEQGAPPMTTSTRISSIKAANKSKSQGWDRSQSAEVNKSTEQKMKTKVAAAAILRKRVLHVTASGHTSKEVQHHEGTHDLSTCFSALLGELLRSHRSVGKPFSAIEGRSTWFALPLFTEAFEPLSVALQAIVILRASLPRVLASAAKSWG